MASIFFHHGLTPSGVNQWLRNLSLGQPNVVHVKFNIFDAIKNQVHFLCGDVRGFTDTHGQLAIAVEPKGSSKDAEVAGSVIKKKGVVLHRDIKFREKLVSRTPLKDFTNLA